MITRRSAIEELSRLLLEELEEAERASLLLDWWSIEPGDPGFDELPARLRQILESEDEPGQPADRVYDPLLLIALRDRFVGVRNEYLAAKRSEAGLGTESVDGAVEVLAPCPVCRFRTLGERGAYHICPVCWWEDDGNDDLATYSGPNHQTLAEGRASYRSIGAVSPRALDVLASDRAERYVPDDSTGLG